MSKIILNNRINNRTTKTIYTVDLNKFMNKTGYVFGTIFTQNGSYVNYAVQFNAPDKNIIQVVGHTINGNIIGIESFDFTIRNNVLSIILSSFNSKMKTVVNYNVQVI